MQLYVAVRFDHGWQMHKTEHKLAKAHARMLFETYALPPPPPLGAPGAHRCWTCESTRNFRAFSTSCCGSVTHLVHAPANSNDNPNFIVLGYPTSDEIAQNAQARAKNRSNDDDEGDEPVQYAVANVWVKGLTDTSTSSEIRAWLAVSKIAASNSDGVPRVWIKITKTYYATWVIVDNLLREGMEADALHSARSFVAEKVEVPSLVSLIMDDFKTKTDSRHRCRSLFVKTIMDGEAPAGEWAVRQLATAANPGSVKSVGPPRRPELGGHVQNVFWASKEA